MRQERLVIKMGRKKGKQPQTVQAPPYPDRKRVKIHVGEMTKEILTAVGGKGGGNQNYGRGTFPDNVTPTQIFDMFKKKLREVGEKGGGFVR